MDDQQEDLETTKLKEDVHEEHAQQEEIIMQEYSNTHTNMVLYQGINVEHPLPETTLTMIDISKDKLPVALTVQTDPNPIATGTSGIHEVPDVEQGMSLFSNAQLWKMVTQLQQSNQKLQLQLQALTSKEKGTISATRVEACTKILNVKPIGSSQTPHLHEDMQKL